MKHKALLITFFFVLSNFILHAQKETTISGTVKDPDADDKMVGVTVMVDSSKGVVTDATGKYHIAVTPGEHKITFSFIGYLPHTKTVTVKEGENKQVNANLIVSSKELNTVVVTGSQYEKKLAQETVSMDVMSKDMIKNTNSRDLGELLAKDPGITVLDGQISIRGGSSYSYGVGTRTAVLVDGQSYMSADLGDAQLKFAPIEDAEQVEIIKGASSVVYGSSALDGVVNVIPSWPKSATPKIDISLYSGVYTDYISGSLQWWNKPQYETFMLNGKLVSYYLGREGSPIRGDIGSSFRYQQKLKNLQLVIGAYVDGVASYLEAANEFRVRTNFRTRYIMPKNPFISMGINGNIMYERSGRYFIGKSSTPDSAYLISQGSSDRYIRTELNPHFIYQNDKGTRYDLEISYLDVYRFGNGTDVNANSQNFGLDNKFQYKWKQGIVLTVGLPFSSGIAVSNLYTGFQTQFSTATYAQAEYNYKRLSLVLGLRYEISKIDTVVESGLPVFRSGINYKVGQATWLRGSWGQGYRLPTIGERFVAATFSQGIYVVPQPALQVEKSWNLELGVKQGMKIRNWSAFFDFSTFLSQYQNYVEYSIGSWSNLAANGDTLFKGLGSTVFGLQPHNDKQARIFGWEASFVSSGNIGPVKITTMIGYTYTYAANLDTVQGLSGALAEEVTVDNRNQRNLGTFFANAFNYFPKQLNPNDTAAANVLAVNRLLFLRARHLVRGDVEITYKKFTVGGTAYFSSFPENLGATIKTAINFLGGSTLNTYISEHLNGDWVFDARVAYQISQRFKLSLICKNIGNRFVMSRPGKIDPPRNLTVQLNITL